jgi:hypothetical protein
MMTLVEMLGGVLYWGWLLVWLMLLMVLPFAALYVLFAVLAKVAGWIRRRPPARPHGR